MRRTGLLRSPSVATRIVVGMADGFVLGIIGLLVLNFCGLDLPLFMQIGTILWYTLIGYLIGIAGAMVRWPLLIKIPMPWWVRGPLMCAEMNAVLVLLAHAAIAPIVEPVWPALADFWIMLLASVVVGVIAGALLDYTATRFGGQGTLTLTPDTQ